MGFFHNYKNSTSPIEVTELVFPRIGATKLHKKFSLGHLCPGANRIENFVPPIDRITLKFYVGSSSIAQNDSGLCILVT
jgi:hypothetical protein